jgi:hypothetical protein
MRVRFMNFYKYFNIFIQNPFQSLKNRDNFHRILDAQICTSIKA